MYMKYTNTGKCSTFLDSAVVLTSWLFKIFWGVLAHISQGLLHSELLAVSGNGPHCPIALAFQYLYLSE